MNIKVWPRLQHFSGFSSKMRVANSAVMTCPETLTHQLKRELVCVVDRRPYLSRIATNYY